MRFCKNCIHYAVCERHAGDIPDYIIEGYNYDVIETLCHDFRENLNALIKEGTDAKTLGE